jgi:hypothetical protein
VHREQNIEGRADGLVVIDDENGVIRQAGPQLVADWKSHALRCLRFFIGKNRLRRFSRTSAPFPAAKSVFFAACLLA